MGKFVHKRHNSLSVFYCNPIFREANLLHCFLKIQDRRPFERKSYRRKRNIIFDRELRTMWLPGKLMFVCQLVIGFKITS